MNKSRLANIRNKTMTISKLELQAAVLALRLKAAIVEELKLNIDIVHLWSDSAIVLKYIRNENVNFGQFIMHRANKIRNNFNIQDWWFIPTELNVADGCSRVVKHNTLTNEQENIDVEIDVGVYRISQDLNFQSNVTINQYSKEASILINSLRNSLIAA